MIFYALLALTTLVPFAWGTVYQVYVGDESSGAATYSPNTLNAGINDTVVFIFAGSHTVTQTAFDAPCTYNASQAAGIDRGFDSGYLDIGANFSVTVTENAPIWIRCDTNCGVGMVAAINPPLTGNQTFQAFQERALATSATSITSSASPSMETSTATKPSAARARYGSDGPLSVLCGALMFTLCTVGLHFIS